jgi:serine/threonine protein kinase
MPLTLPRLRDGQFLGRGSSKSVTAHQRNGGLVAVLSSSTTDLAREAMLMKKLSETPHTNLLPLLGVELDENKRVCVVVPVALFGSMRDLADHLEFDGLHLQPSHVAEALRQVSSGTRHLHQQGIVHGDLRADNVLVFQFDPESVSNLHVRIGDYGEAHIGRAPLDCMQRLVRELYALVPR